MKNAIQSKRLFLATFLSLATLGATASLNPVFADGTHPSSTGPVCKGQGPCNTLEANCKGKYVDATDSNGTVYGKCYPKKASIGPRLQLKQKSNQPMGLQLAN